MRTVNHCSPFPFAAPCLGWDTHTNSYCIRRISSSQYEEFIDSRNTVRIMVVDLLGITKSSNEEVRELLGLHAETILITVERTWLVPNLH